MLLPQAKPDPLIRSTLPRLLWQRSASVSAYPHHLSHTAWEEPRGFLILLEAHPEAKGEGHVTFPFLLFLSSNAFHWENLSRNVVFRLLTEQRRIEVELRPNRQNRYPKFWRGLMMTITEGFRLDGFSKMINQSFIFLEVYEGFFTHSPLSSDILFVLVN